MVRTLDNIGDFPFSQRGWSSIQEWFIYQGTYVSMGFWLADMQFMAGSKGAQEITFNLRGDYIVAVEQAARSTGGAVDAWGRC